MNVSWISNVLVLLVLVLGIRFLGGGLASLVVREEESLREVDPASRELLLVLWAALPWGLTVLGALALLLAPSLLALAGVGLGHVHGGPGSDLHPLASPGVGPVGLILPLMGLTAGYLLALGLRCLRVHREVAPVADELLGLAGDEFREGVRSLPAERPGAWTVGLLRPRTYLTEGLAAALSQEELDAVLAHEAAHRQRRDGVRRLALEGLLAAYPPAAAEVLSRLYAQTCEEICDRGAAGADRGAQVAQTLLAVERLVGRWEEEHTLAALGIRGSCLEERVRSLLRPSWEGRAWRQWWQVQLCVGLLVTVGALPLHHFLEVLLGVAG